MSEILVDRIYTLKADKARLLAENARLESELASQKEMTDAQFNTAEKLRAENARLAAALRAVERNRFIHGTVLRLKCTEALEGSPEALRDLLAPTVELHEWLLDVAVTGWAGADIQRKIQDDQARLRAVMGEKA